MPTARELLDQADALMRRNRGRVPEPDIPELTEEVAAMAAPQAARVAARPSAAARHEPADDVPELTDVVIGIEEVTMESEADVSDESLWLESQLGAASVTGPAPDSIAVVPPSTLRAATTEDEESEALVPPYEGSDVDEPAPESAAAALASALAAREAGSPPAPVDAELDAMLEPPAEGMLEGEVAPSATDQPQAALDERVPALDAAQVEAAEDARPEVPVEVPIEVAIEAPAEVSGEVPAGAPVLTTPSWEQVAEEIRMQVLQRIDIFTDTGLQGELAARLQPVVDRASADLIATINREVGQLLRAYVAEAIEREITKWRESNP